MNYIERTGGFDRSRCHFQIMLEAVGFRCFFARRLEELEFEVGVSELGLILFANHGDQGAALQQTLDDFVAIKLQPTGG